MRCSDVDEVERRAKAAKIAERIFKNARPATAEHPYLAAKAVKGCRLVLLSSLLGYLRTQMEDAQ